MGNNFLNISCTDQLQRLNITQEQKQKLKIYLWRANPETNQYIARVKLNYLRSKSDGQKGFDCFKNISQSLPNIQFQKYICNFRNLRKRLNIQKLLCVFRYVLNGHQQIYRNLGSTLINQRCCFINHQGEIRIWINPNYYLNDFWQKKSNQFRFKSFSCHNSNRQTPRFMNKEEFQFQNTIQNCNSEGIIIQKIIQFMSNFSLESSISDLFWMEIQNYTKINFKHQTFQGIHKFLNTFSSINRIPFLKNIKKVVDQLINEGLVLNLEKQNFKNQKKSLTSSPSNYQTIKSINKETFQNKNLFIETSFNDVSILDLKNSMKDHKKYDHNSNLSRLLATTTNNQVSLYNEKDLDKLFQSHQKQQNQCLSTQLKEKRFGHKLKLSKSLVSPTAAEKIIQQEQKPQIIPTIRSQAFKKLFFQHNPNKTSIHCRNKSSIAQTTKKLNYSYQYSINLHTIAQNFEKISQKSQSNSNPISISLKSSKLNEKSLTKHMQPWIQQELRMSKHSKTGQILKNGNNSRSFQIKEQQSEYYLNDQKENNSRLSKRKQKHVILLKKESGQNKINQRESIGPFKDLIKTCQVGKNGLKIQNQHQNQSKNLFSSFKDDQIQTTKKELPIKVSVPTTPYLRKRQSYCFDIKNFNKLDQTLVFKDGICEQSENKKHTSRLPTTDDRMQNSNTSIKHKISQQKKSIVNKQYVKPPEVLNSVLLNVISVDKQVQQQIIRSKRRISLGQTDQFGIDVNTLNPITTQNGDIRTYRTITRLVSQNNLQTSVGSFTSDQLSNCDQNDSKYTGILTKMGRSAHLKKVDSKYLNLELQIKKNKSIIPYQQMPNFHKTKSIYDHGLNRSMKF